MTISITSIRYVVPYLPELGRVCQTNEFPKKAAGFPQKLALGLSVGKGLFCQINLTTFITPRSHQWGHGLIFGEGINTHYAVKMPNSYPFYTFVHSKEITQVNIVVY